jgi:altronate dehydratase small subunit
MLHANSLPRALVLSAKDNVATVLNGATAGAVLACEGGTVTCACDVPPGHKVALVPIPRGGKIIKFGVPIGTATRDIASGEHVHVQNVTSDYTPTWTTG